MTAMTATTLALALTNNRASDATYIDDNGNMVGVDFVTVSAVAASTGTKNYTVSAGSNRGWAAGMPVIVRPTDNTSNISMTGTVTSYNSATGALVLAITATGSDTTTTKTDWRIGYLGARPDCDFMSPYDRIGFRSEETRTNSVRNGDGVGATSGVVGSGGALPTNWTFPTTGGLTCTVTAGVNERGVAGVYIRLNGTTSGTSALIRFESLTQISHIQGQQWGESFYSRLSAGSLANISSVQMSLEEATSGGSVLNQSTVNMSLTSVMARYMKHVIASNTTGARVCPGIQFNFSSGVAVDVTLFVGGVQLESARSTANGTAQAGGASSITLASGASSTTDFYAGWSIIIRAGTGAGQTNTITAYNGSTKVATVQTAWSTAPDATSTYSVFSTALLEDETSSYIPTRGVSMVRSADNFIANYFAQFFTGLAPNEGTIYIKAITAPWYDTTQTASPRVFAINDTTTSNDHRAYKSLSSLTIALQTNIAGVAQCSFSSGATIGTKAVFSLAYGYKNNDMAISFNGGAVSTDTTSTAMPTGVSQLVLGSANNNTVNNGTWNGWVVVARFIPRRISNADLVLLSAGNF